MIEKQAGGIYDSVADPVVKALKQYGPEALAMGGAGAGLAYLASRVAQHRADVRKRERAEAGSSDILIVNIPQAQKTAAFSMNALRALVNNYGRQARAAVTQAARQTGMGVQSAITSAGQNIYGAGLATAGATARHMQRNPYKYSLGVTAVAGNEIGNKYFGTPDYIAQANDAAKEYERKALDAATHVVQSAPETYKNVKESVAKAFAQPSNPKPEGNPGGVLMAPALWLGSSIIGSTLGFGAVNDYLRSKQKVEEGAKLERAKAEYSRLLGRSLVGPKTAAMAEWPTVEGYVTGVAEQFCAMDKSAVPDNISPAGWVIGGTGMLAMIAGIIGHNYVYNRETAADEALKDSRIKPPRSIRLVSTPVPNEEPQKLANVQAEVLDFIIKGAGIVEIIEQGIIGLKEDDDKDRDTKKNESAKAHSEQIDSNTIIIHTPNGDIEVNANDPRAREIMLKKKKQLTNAMAGAVAISE